MDYNYFITSDFYKKNRRKNTLGLKTGFQLDSERTDKLKITQRPTKRPTKYTCPFAGILSTHKNQKLFSLIIETETKINNIVRSTVILKTRNRAQIHIIYQWLTTPQHYALP